MKKHLLAIAFWCSAALAAGYAQGLTTPADRVFVSSFHFASQWPGIAGYTMPTTAPTTTNCPKLYLPEATSHFAFFCRMELKLENATKLPIRFRLGDVDYVDRLEGKRD